jgi:hypothetical protein
MKVYLKNLVKQLKNYSLTLSKSSILTDKPWAMIDDEIEMQKLIFKKDKELIMSKNGIVTIGKWDYFSEAKSLLIDRIENKILCKEEFIDEAILILKLDGTEDRYFTLANENLIPDLDINEYLKKLRTDKLNLAFVEISDGRVLEISRSDPYGPILLGQLCFIDGSEAPDGIYLTQKGSRFHVFDHRLRKITTMYKYFTKERQEVIIEQGNSSYALDDQVFINSELAPDGKYKFGFMKTIVVKNGRIVKC